MKKYTYKEKKEARDFLTAVVGINLDHCNPHDMDDKEVKEVRDTFIFHFWLLGKAVSMVVQNIRDAIIKKSH